jgi:hypothetical protein
MQGTDIRNNIINSQLYNAILYIKTNKIRFVPKNNQTMLFNNHILRVKILQMKTKVKYTQATHLKVQYGWKQRSIKHI